MTSSAETMFSFLNQDNGVNKKICTFQFFICLCYVCTKFRSSCLETLEEYQLEHKVSLQMEVKNPFTITSDIGCFKVNKNGL